MRKLTWGLAVTALCAAAACGGMCEGEIKEPQDKQRLVLVSREQPASWAHICIFYDEQTKVMYMTTRTGGIVTMVDAQGEPLLYTEE